MNWVKITIGIICIFLLLVPVTAQTSTSIGISGIVKEQVKPIKPVADFIGAPITGSEPLTVSFTDKSIGGPTSWKWEYKTGSNGWKKFSNVQNPVNTFSKGSYDIRLTATNSMGNNVITKQKYIVVSEKPKKPVARIDVNTNYGRAPLRVIFEDDSLYNPLRFRWDFGDGSTSSLENPPAHVYNHAGMYNVKLTVSNNAGSDTTTKYIVVLPQRWPDWYWR